MYYLFGARRVMLTQPVDDYILPINSMSTCIDSCRQKYPELVTFGDNNPHQELRERYDKTNGGSVCKRRR